MRGSCPQDLGCHVPARLTIVYLPLHGLQSSSLLCVILNALLTHPAPMHLRSPRKLMSILWGTRCWIRGSKWKRFRTSHITGIESKPRGREKMEKPTLLPLSAHQPPRDMPPKPLEAFGAGAFMADFTKAKWRLYVIFSFLLCRSHWIWGSV